MTQAGQDRFSAADLIEALRKRARKSLRPMRLAGEFPEGWSAWFAAMSERLGAITGATADAIVAIFLQRELAARPRRAAELNRWQSFTTLWRQQWHPAEAEERRVRLLAITITIVVHVVLVVILLWLAYVRFTAAPAAQGEEIVQVEYIGTGTPKDQGGGPPAGENLPSDTAVSAPTGPIAHRAPAPAPQAKPSTATQPTPPSEPPAPPSPTPAGEQPLQVTEKPVPDTTFVLPPPIRRRIDMPQVQITVPQVQVPIREVELPRSPSSAPAAQLQQPVVAVPVPEVQREPVPVVFATPLPAVNPSELPPHPVAVPTPPSAAPVLRQVTPEHEPPRPQAPSTNIAQTPARAPQPAAARAPTAAAPASSRPPATRDDTQPTSVVSGTVPSSAPNPGAWPTPRRGDDWGASTRQRPGGNAGRPGLLNADGTPRLATGTADAGGGFPPGSDHWTREQFDRAGSWLKRAPNDYSPTRFDRVWVPSETLLEEWVRRNVREVLIPIPGSTKKLHCVVSLLQLAGGCAISNPNLNDQEATARPPPDIPFKPELLDQSGLRKSGAP